MMPSNRAADWFERLVGFLETEYAATQRQLKVEGTRLHSLVTGQSYGIGILDVISLQDLRARVHPNTGEGGRLRVKIVKGDVRKLHRAPEFAGALFQVASQFNLLEMICPDVTPEDGVARYERDGTQGPACAIAAGAATLYRNYFVPVGTQMGQTRDRQINCLADVGKALADELGMAVEALWTMENGYARCMTAGLEAIGAWIEAASAEHVDAMRGHLRIGVHWDVDVTDVEGPVRSVVSQAFCSALPVNYYPEVPRALWKQFASLVLEAAYEATLCAAIFNAQRGGSNVVLLTQLGGGAFGNSDMWIQGAMQRALRLVRDADLDVRLVSYGEPSANTVALVQEFG
jgi:hypothetical protein